jgi:peptidoglycan hydrolase-like protein with peptidoglycan-binding domain
MDVLAAGLLRRGSKGSAVVELQHILNDLGFKDDNDGILIADGSFGPATEAAVNKFKDRFLKDGNIGDNRGIVGPTTWEAIFSADALREVLKIGSKGDHVVLLQKRLNHINCGDAAGLPLVVDGRFGRATEEAVNRFKDSELPGGNMAPWRGMVGNDTWLKLSIAEPFEDPVTPELSFIPPALYNSPAGRPWSVEDLAAFKITEAGRSVLWDGVVPALLVARDKFDAAIRSKGWRVNYTSGKRSLIQQAHFYDLRNGAKKDTQAYKDHAKKHGLSMLVSKPNPGAPHIRGIAFDAVVTDGAGKRLNPMSGSVNKVLLDLAHRSGLKTPPKNDNVHWQLV